MTNALLILILAALLFGGGAVLTFLKGAALAGVALAVMAVVALIAASLIRGLWSGLKDVGEAIKEFATYLARDPRDAIYRAGLVFWFPYRLTYLAIIDLRDDKTSWDRFLSYLSIFLGLIFSAFWILITAAFGLMLFMIVAAMVGLDPGA